MKVREGAAGKPSPRRRCALGRDRTGGTGEAVGSPRARSAAPPACCSHHPPQQHPTGSQEVSPRESGRCDPTRPAGSQLWNHVTRRGRLQIRRSNPDGSRKAKPAAAGQGLCRAGGRAVRSLVVTTVTVHSGDFCLSKDAPVLSSNPSFTLPSPALLTCPPMSPVRA